MADYDVIVCGLGPVGQLLALVLGDLGVKTLAIDRAGAVHELPRAAVIDDEVLRILQSVGVDAAVLEGAQVQANASIVTAAGRAVEVLSARTGALGHPPLVSIHQPTMERAMMAALGSRESVETQRGVELAAFEAHADHVDVMLRVGGGDPQLVSSRFLVGCDGASSYVRTQLDIPFDGRTAAQRWIVVDALVDRPLRKAPHPLFVGDARRPAVTLPMSPGRHRWEWMLHPGEDELPLLEPSAIRRAIDPWLDGEQVEIERAVVYTFHTRMADRWRAGRVFLAGDAAHVMPPFAGQGFSSGARDAANLGWKLHAALAGAPDELLDSYELERRPHVAAMQRTANRMGALVQTTRPRLVQVRDAVLSGVDGTALQRWLATNVKPLPSYRRGAFSRRPSRRPWRRGAGTLFPQAGRLDDELGLGWAAVSLDPAASAALVAAGLTVRDPGSDAAWLRARACTWALLRPDRFVFACGRASDVPSALAHLRRLRSDASRSPAPRSPSSLSTGG